jgi:hypothetical protein
MSDRSSWLPEYSESDTLTAGVDTALANVLLEDIG